MRDVKVRRLELLGKIKANREKHLEEYDEAIDGYKAAAIEEIDRAVAKLKNRVEELERGEVIHLAGVSFKLPVPQNHVKDYDQAITMLEMRVDDELTIRADEFACYVMDDWEWMHDFKAVTRNYSNR